MADSLDTCKHDADDGAMDTMPGMASEQIADSCHGKLYGSARAAKREVTCIVMDNRLVTPGGVFVAIKGERVDGNRFVPDAYASGALCVISEIEPESAGVSLNEEQCYIVVDDCRQALKEIATYYRGQCPVKIVGVTGSVGKTSTKEMLASVLSKRFDTLKTQGNYNNELGVPLTLFRLRRHHEVAVVEMGISDFGEMARLSAIVKPDICVITNIGQCHLENLGDRDGVLRAKTEIFSSMNPDGAVFLYGDDDKLATVQSVGDKGIEPVFYGETQNCQVSAKNLVLRGFLGTDFEAVTRQGNFAVHVPGLGKHMVANALAAIAVGSSLGMTGQEMADGIAAFVPIDGHGSVLETEDYMILDDCYNANPVSVKAGIDVLTQMDGRKVAILGDMFELGEKERQYHCEVGSYAAEKGIDVLIFIGTLAKEYVRGAEQVGSDSRIVWFATVEEAVDCLGAKLPKQQNPLLQRGDFILVKASHGMHFERLVEAIQ